MIKFKKIQTGVYESEDGQYRIIKDGYEPIRDESNRYTTEWQHLIVAPEEVCWLVHRTDDPAQTNLFITDTLREAKQRVEGLAPSN